MVDTFGPSSVAQLAQQNSNAPVQSREYPNYDKKLENSGTSNVSIFHKFNVAITGIKQITFISPIIPRNKT